MWLLGSAPAFAACNPGTVGTQLAAGLWAVKIQGFRTDTATCGTSCPDPTPRGESCIGVIQSDGACGITGGDMICDSGTGPGPGPGTGITAPSMTGGFPDFSGTASPANDVGSYFFNSNNTGEIVIQDPPSGKVFAFGINAELGNSEMRGASLFGPPGVQKDPLAITIEKRNQTITAANFNGALALTFDPAGGSTGSSGLGKGFDAVGVSVVEHLDPESSTFSEGGGTIFFNVDGGYDSDVVPGIQLFPSSVICDFHESILSQHTGDATQLSTASINGDYACPLGGAGFQTAAVLFGSTLGNAFVGTVGALGTSAPGMALGTAGKMSSPGTGQGQAATLVASISNPHPSKTVTITNGSTEPIDWSAISIIGVPDVTATTLPSSQNSQCTAAGVPAACCTGAGTGHCTELNCTGANTPFNGCTAAGQALCPGVGSLRAWNPVGSAVKSTCQIILTDSGATCTTGAPEVGTYRLVGADHAMISGTPNAAGIDFGLTCK